MFPSDVEQLGELNQLDSESLKAMEKRYRRLADLCQRRRLWLEEWTASQDAKRVKHEERFTELKSRIRRFWIYGRGADWIVSECKDWDEQIVRYWVKQTAKEARQAKGPKDDFGPLEEIARRRSRAATGP